jgi:SAM-dependent methyltransferase
MKKLIALTKTLRWIFTFSMDIIVATLKSKQKTSNLILNFAQGTALNNQLKRLSGTGATAYYAYQGFNRIQRFLLRHHHRPSRVLEIGTGSNFGILSLFMAAGATKSYGVDIEPMDERYNAEFYESLSEYLKSTGSLGWYGHPIERKSFPHFSFPDSPGEINFQKLVANIEYLAPCSSDNISLADNSVDLHYSIATLEHVPNVDGTIREMKRLLVNGGLAVHEIDLSYHRYDPNPLTLLNYSEEDWNKMTNQYGMGVGVDDIWQGKFTREIYCNRFRTSDFVELFKAHGFDVLEVKPIVRFEPTIIDRKICRQGP